MSPDDIAQVTRSWSEAREDQARLVAAIAARLPGADACRRTRATWIVRSVSCLTPALDHPMAFAPAAADLIAQRAPVTLDDLASDRDALLGALAECRGPLDRDAAHAWDLAIGLFAEIVCAAGLDPFGCAEDRAVP